MPIISLCIAVASHSKSNDDLSSILTRRAFELAKIFEFSKKFA
jgi:hypothetical protein